MLCFTRQDLRGLQDLGDPNSLHLTTPNPQSGRERLRHLVMGSPDGVRGAINDVVLTYPDTRTYQRDVVVPLKLLGNLWYRAISAPDLGLRRTGDRNPQGSYISEE